MHSTFEEPKSPRQHSRLIRMTIVAGLVVSICGYAGIYWLRSSQCSANAEAYRRIAARLTSEQAKTLHSVASLTDNNASCSATFVYLRNGHEIEVSFLDDVIHGLQFASSDNGRTARLINGFPYNDFTPLRFRNAGDTATLKFRLADSTQENRKIEVTLKVERPIEYSIGTINEPSISEKYEKLLDALGALPEKRLTKSPPQTHYDPIILHLIWTDEATHTVLLTHNVDVVKAWQNEEVDAEIVVDALPLRSGDYAVTVQVLNDNAEFDDGLETGVRTQQGSVKM